VRIEREAEWDWGVTVEIVRDADGSTESDIERWTMLTTDMDPRQVRYR
jgi:hypothetical protein